MIEVFDQSGAGQFVTATKENAFYYYPYNDLYVPRMKSISPHSASSEEAITIHGHNFGYWIQVPNPLPNSTHIEYYPLILEHKHHPMFVRPLLLRITAIFTWGRVARRKAATSTQGPLRLTLYAARPT